MNQFVKGLEQEENMTTTTNGALALKSTKDNFLDLFSQLASKRQEEINSNNKHYYDLFDKCLEENLDLSIRLLLYIRDIRSGCGERLIARNFLTYAAKKYPSIVTEKLLDKITELGRCDDILIFLDSHPLEVTQKIKKDLMAGNGLMAKWLPRQGAIASKIRTQLSMTPKQWRKTLVGLTQVVETKMCQKKWNDIEFSHVPSVAMTKYVNAFKRNAGEKYQSYLDSLVKGETKVNVGAVFPYQIVEALGNSEQLADGMWQTLPFYTGKKIFPVIDVSGSMSCSATTSLSCMDIAISLGLYLSEKQESPFNGYFATFDTNPHIMYTGDKKTLKDKVEYIRFSPWGGSTDIHKTLKLIIDIARKNNVPKDDMPEYLVILSDMQFDAHGNTFINDHTEKMFNEAGYEMPKIVFWNLASIRYGNTLVEKDTKNIIEVSGFSHAIAMSLLEDIENVTPVNIMLNTLMKPEYTWL